MIGLPCVLRTLLLAALCAGPVLALRAADAPATQPTVLITGSNRGIGLEFARQYATRGVLKLKPGEPPPEEFAALMPLIRAGKIPLITPEESVTAMVKLIDGLTPAQSGIFLNYDGRTLPW